MREILAKTDYFPIKSSHHNAPSVARLLILFTDVLTLWAHRARTRELLRKAGPDVLADIGLSHAEAANEAAKWFWQK